MSFIVDNKTHDLTAPYGPRRQFWVDGVLTAAFHYGMDFAPEVRGTNTILYMPKGGTIRSVGTKRDAGRYVIAYIPQWNKWIRYCHMRSYAVRAGQTMSEAQPVGRMGATGTATGVHVHFEVYEDEGLTQRVDPKPYLWYEPNPVDYKASQPIPQRPKPQPAPSGVRIGSTLRLRNWVAYTDKTLKRYLYHGRDRSWINGDYEVIGIANGNFKVRGPGGEAWVSGKAKAGLI